MLGTKTRHGRGIRAATDLTVISQGNQQPGRITNNLTSNTLPPPLERNKRTVTTSPDPNNMYLLWCNLEMFDNIIKTIRKLSKHPIHPDHNPDPYPKGFDNITRKGGAPDPVLLALLCQAMAPYATKYQLLNYDNVPNLAKSLALLALCSLPCT